MKLLLSSGSAGADAAGVRVIVGNPISGQRKRLSRLGTGRCPPPWPPGIAFLPEKDQAPARDFLPFGLRKNTPTPSRSVNLPSIGRPGGRVDGQVQDGIGKRMDRTKTNRIPAPRGWNPVVCDGSEGRFSFRSPPLRRAPGRRRACIRTTPSCPGQGDRRRFRIRAGLRPCSGCRAGPS